MRRVQALADVFRKFEFSDGCVVSTNEDGQFCTDANDNEVFKSFCRDFDKVADYQLYEDLLLIARNIGSTFNTCDGDTIVSCQHDSATDMLVFTESYMSIFYICLLDLCSNDVWVRKDSYGFATGLSDILLPIRNNPEYDKYCLSELRNYAKHLPYIKLDHELTVRFYKLWLQDQELLLPGRQVVYDGDSVCVKCNGTTIVLHEDIERNNAAGCLALYELRTHVFPAVTKLADKYLAKMLYLGLRGNDYNAISNGVDMLVHYADCPVVAVKDNLYYCNEPLYLDDVVTEHSIPILRAKLQFCYWILTKFHNKFLLPDDSLKFGDTLIKAPITLVDFINQCYVNDVHSVWKMVHNISVLPKSKLDMFDSVSRINKVEVVNLKPTEVKIYKVYWAVRPVYVLVSKQISLLYGCTVRELSTVLSADVPSDVSSRLNAYLSDHAIPDVGSEILRLAGLCGYTDFEERLLNVLNDISGGR